MKLYISKNNNDSVRAFIRVHCGMDALIKPSNYRYDSRQKAYHISMR